MLEKVFLKNVGSLLCIVSVLCTVCAIYEEYAACDQFSFVNFLENKATCKVDLCFCVDCCRKHFWSGQPDVIPGKWLGDGN